MSSETHREAPELRHYLSVLRRRKAPVLLTVVVCVAAALISSLIQKPVYAATAEVLLEGRTTEAFFDPTTGRAADPQRTLQTQLRVIQSEPLRAAAAEKLGYKADISVRPAAETDVILLRAENVVPKRAADIANAYADAYIDFRRKRYIDDALAASSEVQGKIDVLQGQIDQLGARLAAIPPCIGNNPPPECGERDSIQQDRDAKVAQIVPFRQKLDELQLTASLQTGGAQVMSRAAVPTSPVRPKPVKSATIALILGGFVGLAFAFLIDYLDDSIKSKEDFERAAPSLSVVSLIPALPTWKSKGEARVVSLSEPHSPPAEAYRTLRTSIQFMSVDQPIRRIQVTSPNAQEGKTTTLANLGVALARAGKRVVLVCCDLRRPRIHEFFGLGNSLGFTSVLLDDINLSDAIQKVPGAERLYLLASGSLPPNPSELLQSRKAAELFTRLESDGNVILIDTPPVLPVSDALIVSKVVHGTLLVCSSGNTSRKELSRSIELLENVDARLIGAVLNGVTPDSGYAAYNYEYYTSSSQVPSSNGNGRATKQRGRRRAGGKPGKL